MSSGVIPEFDVEHQGRDNEEAKNDDLENQPADNDMPTKRRVNGALPHPSLDPQPSTARLDDETENVAEHENACEPSRRYYGAMSGVQSADQSAKRHVQGCRKQDWSKKKQGRLQDVWDKFAGGIICQSPANVADGFD